MYHVSDEGVDERMINVHYYYYYLVSVTRQNTDFGADSVRE